MARVEKQQNLEKKLGEVKGEVVKEVRRRTRKDRPWLTCSLLVLAVLLGVLLWGAWLVAATGLVPVPGLSSVAYESPKPLREVLPGVLVETVLQEQFATTLTKRLYEGDGTLRDRTIEARLSENSITASLRTLLEEFDVAWIEASEVQAVIDPDAGIELFVPLKTQWSQPGTALIVRFGIEVVDGLLIVMVRDIRVGSADIPDALITAFLKPFLDKELARLNMTMVGYAKISSVEILSRELVIYGELAVEIQSP